MSTRAIPFLLLLLLVAGAALARDAGTSSGYQLLKDPSGALKLRVTTEAAAAGMWLGVTMYQPGSKEGQSQLLALKQGSNIHEIQVAPSFRNGTFEAAVWSRKIPAAECEPGDEAARKAGYRLGGMASYLWGYLVVP